MDSFWVYCRVFLDRARSPAWRRNWGAGRPREVQVRLGSTLARLSPNRCLAGLQLAQSEAERWAAQRKSKPEFPLSGRITDQKKNPSRRLFISGPRGLDRCVSGPRPQSGLAPELGRWK